jgi:DNA-binding response OmpR family regulator
VRVLVVDDERKTSSYLKTGLSEQGFVVDVARNGDDGLHLAAHGEYDLRCYVAAAGRLVGPRKLARRRKPNTGLNAYRA